METCAYCNNKFFIGVKDKGKERIPMCQKHYGLYLKKQKIGRQIKKKKTSINHGDNLLYPRAR